MSELSTDAVFIHEGKLYTFVGRILDTPSVDDDCLVSWDELPGYMNFNFRDYAEPLGKAWIFKTVCRNCGQTARMSTSPDNTPSQGDYVSNRCWSCGYETEHMVLYGGLLAVWNEQAS